MDLSIDQIRTMTDAEIVEHNRQESERVREWKSRQPVGHVYFLRGGNSVKIGYSTNPRTRQEKLRNGNPEAVFICKIVPGSRATEAKFHRRFAEYRIRGEWFDLRGRLAKYLERDLFPVTLPAAVDDPRPSPFYIL